MLRDKRWRFTWIGIILLGVMLLGIPLVYAGDMNTDPADVAYQEVVDQRLADLEEIAADREAVIEELVNMWFMDKPGWEEEFRLALSQANASKLLIMLNAKSYAEVQAILSGGTPDEFSADTLGTPFALGDLDKDFVFTPVKPCRIIDTRKAGGKISSNTSRNFYVYGAGPQMSAQGGNPAGCTAPRGEPRAVHMNIVAVNSNAPGWLTVWPKGTTRPLAGILNFSPTDKTDPISNAFTVKTSYNVGQDISVYAKSTTHVVADVMGYYDEVNKDEFKVRFAGSRSGNVTGLSVAGGVPCTNHAGGEVTIFVPGPGKIMVTAQAFLGLKVHTGGQLDRFLIFIGSSPTDCTAYDFSQGYNTMGWLVPGAIDSFSSLQAGATVTVSRTFTVLSAGTKKYYLNGKRTHGNGEGSFYGSSMQAVYYPK